MSFLSNDHTTFSQGHVTSDKATSQDQILRLIMPGIFGIFVFCIGPLLAYLELVQPMTGFAIFGISALFGVLSISWALWLIKKKQKTAVYINLALGLIPALTIITGVWMGRDYPLLNDVSTDLDNPPRFLLSKHELQTSEPESVDTALWAEIVRESYPGLISLQLPSPAPIVFEQVKRIVDQRPDMQTVRIDQDALVLEGVATTSIFKFQDDFIIRLQQLDSTTQVDMRSKSRVGKGDFGANANRIQDFFSELGSRFGLVEDHF